MNRKPTNLKNFSQFDLKDVKHGVLILEVAKRYFAYALEWLHTRGYSITRSLSLALTPTNATFFLVSFPTGEEDDLSFEQLNMPRDQIYRLIEREFPCGPYLDLFGAKRMARPNWHTVSPDL